ncbi:DUF397 domain-containing protein [Streptomyces lunaelactis]|uniref:DUF397 domain-containing protein n=1 Tax=Streptomyces lunaelactis TaxID=1535768 RepID=A0A2R4SZZ6_9ACTN|nr:DUF397 domain-containing protein [Streptomyces lunaelactis]AVZ72407.1 DUF397 domain-containing protein [Streptomyces lunaelactis]NUK90152.1 DUF397 domain-containing protein [Streptomyces lunaelactis]
MTVQPSADSAAELMWFKSSYSTGEGPECVEVASAPGTVRVRDSKDKAGAQLAFADGSWAAFVPFAASR